MDPVARADGSEPHTFDWQAGGSGDESWRGKSRQWIDDKPGTSRTLSTTKVPAVYEPTEGDVDAYALRGRADGVEVEPTELPNVRAHTGKDGGGHDGFVHDRRAFSTSGPAKWAEDEEDVGTLRARDAKGEGSLVAEGAPQAFLPRHFTRGKDGAPDDVVPPITADSDRGDGMATVYGFQSTLGSLSDDGIAEDACPPIMARTPPAASIPAPRVMDMSATHGREGAPTQNGVPNMSEPGESLTVTTRGDRHAAFDLPVSAADAALWRRLHAEGYLAPTPIDPRPDGPRYAAMGDAVTVNVAEWIGLRLAVALEAAT